MKKFAEKTYLPNCSSILLNMVTVRHTHTHTHTHTSIFYLSHSLLHTDTHTQTHTFVWIAAVKMTVNVKMKLQMIVKQILGQYLSTKL